MISRLGILFMRMIAPLPLSWVRAMGYVLGMFLYLVVWPRRKVVDTNLRLCFPQWSDAQRRQVETSSGLIGPSEPADGLDVPKTRNATHSFDRPPNHPPSQRDRQARDGCRVNLRRPLAFSKLHSPAAMGEVGQALLVGGGELGETGQGGDPGWPVCGNDRQQHMSYPVSGNRHVVV